MTVLSKFAAIFRKKDKGKASPQIDDDIADPYMVSIVNRLEQLRAKAARPQSFNEANHEMTGARDPQR